ncbi:AEC family transporter [Bradyrhizobium sp. dw_78]|uniref:AEC family transporter n=1 Tax=Bradyrhizobium sp. dw_78 TaxID=2719793 RepID=UPI001BD34FE7|nr:AEC family transporter [Bradyrhizobium sp. dw_78]
MLTSLSVVCPVFALIVAGFGCGRLGLLGPAASSELNRFVVYLGLPALLFQVMADANWPTLWQPGFIASFTIGIVVIFGGTLIYRVANGHHLTDASIDGLNAGYANVGYVGFPLCELIFGRQSLALVTIATILTVSVLFATAIIFVEIGLQTERRPHRLFVKIGKALIRNPLLVAPLLGALWSTTHTPVPEAAKVVLHMLGDAASPCALVSLGLFLAVRHHGSRSNWPIAAMLTALKLIIQPGIAAICAYGIFKLQPMPAAIVVLLSALPTGTGPFMIAEFYKREAVVTSGTILLTTMASVVSLTACLMLLGHVPG